MHQPFQYLNVSIAWYKNTKVKAFPTVISNWLFLSAHSH